MIRARHTFAGALVARFCAGPLLDGAFREVRIAGEGTDRGLPVLMVANHFSWWDGFIQYRINRACFRRTLYVMMLEEQLQRHPLLAGCGCFSVRRHSRSLVETLDYCLEVMQSPENMLLIFPQGAIESMHLPSLAFRPGAAHLAERIGRDFDIALNCNLPEYGAARRPVLNCWWKLTPGAACSCRGALELEANRFYAACRQRITRLP